MNCRAKTLCRLVVLTSILFVGVVRADVARAYAARAEELGWSSLNSKKVEIQNFSSGQGEVLSTYPSWIQSAMNTLWQWEPEKELKKTTPRLIERDPKYMFKELMENMAIRFDVSDTKNFRKVWFHLTPELKVRGLFGIHDFVKKRPFVIIRMGIHGNVDEILAERYLAKIVYQDLDANFLLLESLTSYAFLSQNKNIAFGGIDEGLQTFVIMNELVGTGQVLNPLIKSLHLMGLSMGGQGTFVTALLDQSNGGKIKSILNLCPLINLKETFNYHSRSGFQPALIDLWNARRLHSLFDTYPTELKKSNWWETFFDWKPRFTPTVMGILNRERHQALISVEEVNAQVAKMKWPKGFAEHLNNSKDFYDLNNFWPLYQGVKIPMSLITTPKDPLVKNEFNSELIMKGEQPGDFSSIKSQVFDRGIHCGFSPVYQWDYVVELIQQGLGI